MHTSINGPIGEILYVFIQSWTRTSQRPLDSSLVKKDMQKTINRKYMGHIQCK